MGRWCFDAAYTLYTGALWRDVVPKDTSEHCDDEDETLVLCESNAEMTRLTEVAQTRQLLPQESKDD